MTDLERFGLALENATLEELKRRYHEQALLVHPDRSQAPDAAAQFGELRAAYERAAREVRHARIVAGKHRPCKGCRGKRKVAVRRGFITATVPCPDCGGAK